VLIANNKSPELPKPCNCLKNILSKLKSLPIDVIIDELEVNDKAAKGFLKL